MEFSHLHNDRTENSRTNSKRKSDYYLFQSIWISETKHKFINEYKERMRMRSVRLRQRFYAKQENIVIEYRDDWIN